jgi:hypothetical protein
MIARRILTIVTGYCEVQHQLAEGVPLQNVQVTQLPFTMRTHLPSGRPFRLKLLATETPGRFFIKQVKPLAPTQSAAAPPPAQPAPPPAQPAPSPPRSIASFEITFGRDPTLKRSRDWLKHLSAEEPWINEELCRLHRESLAAKGTIPKLRLYGNPRG